MAHQLERMLTGGDLRSIGRNRELVKRFEDESRFGKMINAMSSADRLVVMRAADLAEKITARRPELLVGFQTQIAALCESARNKELKWHLAQMAPRLKCDAATGKKLWRILKNWALDYEESRIVRTESLQALWAMSGRDAGRRRDFMRIASEIALEEIPSINARLRKLRVLDEKMLKP